MSAKNSAAIRIAYDAVRNYKSKDQLAFEEAVFRPDAHSWLIGKGLGANNRYYLHRFLIANNAWAIPYLARDEEVKLALQEFVPSVESVISALEDPWFFAALKDSIKNKSCRIYAVYHDAMQKSDYGPILMQEVREYRP